MKSLAIARAYYAVKHKTEERYLTGASSAAPRLYMSEGKAEGAIKTIISKRTWSRDKQEDWMVVEWTISERVVGANTVSIPWQQELPLQGAPL